MAKQSIMRIAEAEKAAEDVEAQAKAEAERIIRAAQDEARQITEKAKIKAQQLIEAKVGEAKAKAANIDRDAASDARHGAQSLAKQAANARSKAVSMVIDALVS